MKKCIIVLSMMNFFGYANAGVEFQCTECLFSSEYFAKQECSTFCRKRGAEFKGEKRLDKGACRSSYIDDCKWSDLKYFCSCTK